jgi:hypothetical protein
MMFGVVNRAAPGQERDAAVARSCRWCHQLRTELDPLLLTRNCTAAPTQKKRTTFIVFAVTSESGLMKMPSHLGMSRRRDRRKNFRVEWNLPATIYDVRRHLERPCVLVDLSNSGAKIAGVRAHTIPDEFRLRTPLGDRRSCRVLWRTEEALGVQFTDCMDDDGSSSDRLAVREPTHA